MGIHIWLWMTDQSIYLKLFTFSLKDLVVGAPLYFEDGVGGAVYVYMAGDQVNILCIYNNSSLRLVQVKGYQDIITFIILLPIDILIYLLSYYL